MWNAELDEAQVGIKIVGRNINNFIYLWHYSYGRKRRGTKEPLDEGWKEKSGKAGLKLNIQKMKIMASSPLTSWQIDRESMETLTDFIFLGSKITVDDCSHEN